ncbi:putative disease resistance RPP13-like protein 1 [Arachis hypogaea]|uniref:putative disease resistance RPP13-like protein 1 n=1 Tax=Arachis hypogaea TaxID=3818 RepID=UPI000DECE6B2|nr:putative disease resistance RPP13-like protein 1 [Arachis hypogaea]QHO17818.1 Putative disease resistance RPP13-like protein [Arachis hypogaea]
MVLELVGGAFLGAVFNVLLERIASPEVLSFLKGKKMNNRLLKKLKLILLSIHGVLDDAEGKQITNPAVKEWLDELKDVAYEADDLLDEIYTRSKYGAGEVCNFDFNSWSSFENEVEEKMEEIIEKLEFIAKQKDFLGLTGDIGVKIPQKTPTTSIVEGSNVYGRDDDKEFMIKLLFDVENGDDKIGVIPIVGMAGIGKTTLAQLAYNDVRVKEHFDLRAWVCVSEDFDIFKITETLLEILTMCNHAIRDLDSLQVELKRRLKGKKYLFVLDDMWNENYDDWDMLRNLLQYGAHGSKIIVTTRSERVASIMQTIPSYHLGYLSDEDCWMLFAKHAFDYRSSDTYKIMEGIGKSIAKKCKGLPLAAKTLGGLLRSKTDVKEWDNILKNEIWELSDRKSNILPALRLSYYYLPSHLKRCFAYCSIFPKGYEFDREELILLWMAENLLKEPKRNRRLEEVGDEYFHELVARSFFQQSRHNGSLFVMHDLINDLAKYVSGKFCIRLENNLDEDAGERTRHLSQIIANRYPSINFDAFQKASGLHTFLQLSLVDPPICLFNKVPKDLFMKLRRLRVLSLVGARGSLNELLRFIAKLRHLRYLDVSQTQIKKLPGSICTLYNLQTLKAARCPHLTELPRNMHCLVNLRYLDISASRIERMPLHMSNLKSLQKLSNFFVSKESASSIGELGELSHLRGSLMIQNIKNVVDPKDAMKASLKDKRNLDKLTFDWGRSADTENSQHEKNILEKLQPNTNLEALEIVHYTGTQFPTWLGDPSFFHLVSLSLNHCKYCHILPSLGQLPYLKELHISKFKELVSIGPEFYGVSGCTGNQHFPSLEILTFYGMPAWEKWIHAGESEGCKVFPCLRELHLEECPQLSGDLPTFLPSLTNLTMRYCNQISTSLPKAPAMRSLHVDNCWKVEILKKLMGCRESLESLEIYNSCHSLKSFPLDFFPYLKSLVIWGCENLESLTTSAPQTEGTLELLASLNSLCIWRCHNFVNFPHAGLPTPNLASLKVRYCSKLSSLPKQMHTLLPSLKELQVWSCPEIKSLPNGGLPTNLKSFKIRDCDNLFARRLDWNMSCLASLEHFSVEGKCEDVESFPEEGLLPSTLTQLEIQGLSNLKILDMKGLQNLTSLKKIQILDCCKLESQGEGGTLPLSAVDLDIWKCPLLKEQWQRENKPNISGNHGIWICDQYIEVDEQHDL